MLPPELGQIRDITGETSKALADDIYLSNRAHLAYQALSRGQCRFVDNGQARPMKGYLVEIDSEIETALSTVMPGVKWTNWKPVFLPETDSLIETWTKTAHDFLMCYEPVRVSIRKLKVLTKAERLSRSTWQRVVKAACEQIQAPKKEHMGDESVCWKMEGQSLVKVTAKSFGFKAA